MKNAWGGPLVVATGNAHKLQELRPVLEPLGFEVRAAPQGFAPVEDGKTFAANATIKARALQRELARHHLQACSILADDSGLVVHALQGAPGVMSARYAELSATSALMHSPGGRRAAQDRANRDKLMHALKDVPHAQRAAYFVCVLALMTQDGSMHHFTGKVNGHIPLVQAGDTGFGYDAVFVPDGLNMTFAEAGPSAKAALSHRSRALDGLVEHLQRI